MEEKPIYLIKFQSNKEYQTNLVTKGHLFCNCAKYFQNLSSTNQKQGDIFDCKLGRFSASINSYNPIFCTYAIYKEDMLDGDKIALSAETMKEFSNGNNIYVTIIRFGDFVKQLENFTLHTGIGLYHCKVGYGTPTKEQEKDLFENPASFMFIKKAKFKNQKEYRFVFDDRCKEIIKNEKEFDGMKNVLFSYGTLPENYYISSIKNFSQCFELDLNNCSKDILIKLEI